MCYIDNLPDALQIDGPMPICDRIVSSDGGDDKWGCLVGCCTNTRQTSKWVFVIFCFCRRKQHTSFYSVVCVKIRWRLRISDAEKSSNFNTLRPRQDGRHFPDDILKCIFLNENVWISLTISLKCVRKIQINNIPSLVQIMAWRRPGDKPLSEPMMVSLLTHICVTRSQWVNTNNTADLSLWIHHQRIYNITKTCLRSSSNELKHILGIWRLIRNDVAISGSFWYEGIYFLLLKDSTKLVYDRAIISLYMMLYVS